MFDNTIAMKEGWAISEVGDDIPFRLEKLDGNTEFAFDENAWEFVHSLADQGSFYHQSALQFLEENSPKEFEYIQNHYYYAKG